MITTAHGNLLTDPAEALVNTVNCAGVMGKGIALQFKQAFPENFKAYEKACKASRVKLGEVLIYETGALVGPKYILNFPTKGHWKNPSRIEDIQSGLKDLVTKVRQLNIQSIAIPPLGCGLGGLRWEDVQPLIVAALKGLPVEVRLYAPQEAPKAAERPIRTARPGMTRARALFIALLDRYGREGYQRTLLEVQKIAYFLQEAGEPLRLNFQPHHYGPYAEAVNQVLLHMEGHQIEGYMGDRSPGCEISLRKGAAEEAEAFLADKPDAQAILNRVTDLIERFETPYGMELLATTHWVSTHSPEPLSVDALVQQIHAWTPRKKRLFQPDHIKVASERLRQQGWIA